MLCMATSVLQQPATGNASPDLATPEAFRTELTEAEREEFRAHLSRMSLRSLCKLTGLGRDAVARLVAGLPVRAGTIALARIALVQLRDLPTTAPAPRVCSS